MQNCSFGNNQDLDSDEEWPALSQTGGEEEGECGTEVEVDPDDEKAIQIFMNKNPPLRRTLADIIMEKITEKQTEVGTVMSEISGRPLPQLDPRIIEVYKGVHKVLSKYRSGKLPKAFKIIPALSNWEQVLYLTEPETWTAAAMYQATRIFSSNLKERMAQRFYNLVLLPRIRDDIAEYKRLNFHLYSALKKALFKPGAWFKGILIPLCESGTCTLREAIIIGSILTKCSIPVLHSRMELMCLEDGRLKSTPVNVLAPSNFSTTIRARCDPNLTGDIRTVQNLLALEKKHWSTHNYFGTTQTDIQPHMRRMLAEWMLQVCEEQKCEEEVIYTDNSITVSELLQWELMIVSRLDWDLASVLPSDFLEPILLRLPIVPDSLQVLRKHTHSYIALAAIEFLLFLPSIIVSACVMAAIQRLNILHTPLSRRALMEQLADFLAADVGSLQSCLDQLEVILELSFPSCPPETPEANVQGLP
ncbi:hypothetical protein AAFF_G00144680 [Aldrovandia affinis]|uniref:Cyclin N-terminal domain-containing protein n=1 Tax=Aldrovandia affinis TaxID=143900 RepID=A0AAD7T0K9_9TELE|nr:hypothetical protein AAFF_G00144680 [Aldrovandia affinis]